MFADEILRRLNDDLENISKWSKLNGLALNPKKCEFMVIGSPQRLRHVSFGTLMLNGTPIKRVEAFKYLGIVIDSNISWSNHTDYLCKKVSSRIGILKRIMHCLTLPSAQTVYKTTIQPIFDYCGVVWDSCSEASSLRLQRLQNRAGRIILSADSPSLNNQLEGLDTNYLRNT